MTSDPMDTSKKVALAAAKILGSKSASHDAKTVAATALTQTRSSKSTGSTVAAAAARMLCDPKASKADKSTAASALTHRPAKRR